MAQADMLPLAIIDLMVSGSQMMEAM
jgi:hypothetical protein